MKTLIIWLAISKTERPAFHHGIAALAGHLKKQAHDIRCVVIRAESEIESLPEVVRQARPGCIGFSIMTPQRQYLGPCAKSVRKVFDGVIITGGVHATLDPEDVLRCKEVDGVCLGEGEPALSKLAASHSSGQSHISVPGFWWRKKDGSGSGEIIKNSICRFEPADKFPYPDYSIFDVKSIVNDAAGFFDIMISRGCPYNCTYCCNDSLRTMYEKPRGYFRILSPEKAIETLLHYKKKYPFIKGFNFADDLLVWNTKWFVSFAKRYREKVGLPYTCNCRFEILNETIAHALSESGCSQINFGLESGDEVMRAKVLKRKYTNAQIVKAAKLLHAVKVPFFTYNIFGFPFETEAQMQETVSLNKAIRPSSGCSFFFFPFPKTELFDICEKKELFIPKKMLSLDGYTERPTIKLPNCEEAVCMTLRNELTLYFAAVRLLRLFRIDSATLELGIQKFLLLRPLFFIRLLSRDGFFKRNLRKLMYLGMRQSVRSVL